jgi:uncharacterized RDD family membrane protein YckC
VFLFGEVGTVKNAAFVIKTPEGIVFSQTLAGPAVRFAAWTVDLMSIAVLGLAIAKMARLLIPAGSDVVAAATTVGYFVISIGYGVFLEWRWRGQTLGKRLFRLRVVDAEGMRLQFDQILVRNLLRSVDMLPVFYFVGGLACWVSRRCQRLGDLAANTIVVRVPLVAEPDLDQLLAGKFNSLRHFPSLASRLRQKVSPAEALIALQSLIRRDRFEPAARVELFGRLAEHLRAKVEFPAEAGDGISDEQYVRNVVDLLYRRGAEEAQRTPGRAK